MGAQTETIAFPIIAGRVFNNKDESQSFERM